MEKKLFNEERKRAYMDVAKIKNPLLPKYLENQWGLTAKREEEYGQDLCDWTTSEIIGFYKELFTSSLSVLILLNGTFRNYAEWCLQNNSIKDYQNHFDEIDNDILNTCINHGMIEKGLFNRKMLLSNISQFDNPSDQFLVLGIFEGLYGVGMSDFWHLTMNDFDDNVVTLKSNRKLKISTELQEYAKQAAETFEYYTMAEGGKIMKYKADDERIIKPLWNVRDEENDNILARRMINKLVRISEITDTPYNRVGLHESGRIEYLKSVHKADEDWATTIDNPKNKKEMEYRYGKIYAVKRWLVQYKQYLEM